MRARQPDSVARHASTRARSGLPGPGRTDDPRAPSRRLLGLIALTLVLVGLTVSVVGSSAPAGAHATLQETVPTDDALVADVPGSVELRFDEPVAATTGAVRIIAPDGGRVERSAQEVRGGRTLRVGVDGDAVGTYTVAYRVVSDDGHNISGSLLFHVGTRTGGASVDQSVPLATSVAGGIGRWLSYAGSVVVVGAALLLALVARSGGPGPALPRLSALAAGAALAAATGASLAVVAQVALGTGRSVVAAVTLVPEAAGDSRSLTVAAARAAVLVIGAIVAVVGWRRTSTAGVPAAGAVVAVAGLLAPIAGHPWTADPKALAVGADALHLLAISVWLGLLAALVASGRRLPDAAGAVRAVSGAALVASAVVAITGTTSAWLLLGSTEALLRTASGQLVVVKVVGFATLLGLGWINRSRLVPLLGAVAVPASTAPATTPVPALVGASGSSATGDEDDDRGPTTDGEGGPTDDRPGDGGPPPPASEWALARLLQVVRIEVVVGALVLAATAGLVNQPPGRDQVTQPFTGTRTVDELTMLLEVEPARAGSNEMHLYATDPDGRPAPIDAFEVKAGRSGVPERRLSTEQVSPDHAVVYGASLPSPGAWTVRITTVSAGVASKFAFDVRVG